MAIRLGERHQGRFGSPGHARLGAHLREQKQVPTIHLSFSNQVGRSRPYARLGHS
jgi:hypothetical protein